MIERLVIELLVDRLEDPRDVRVVHDPTELGVEWPFYGEVQGIGVPVQSGGIGADGRTVRGFELKGFYKVNAGHRGIVPNCGMSAN